jgi:signal transduction histidine kinase
MVAHASSVGGTVLPDAGPGQWRVVATGAGPAAGLALFTAGLWIELSGSEPLPGAVGAPLYIVAFGVLAGVAYLTCRRRPANPIGWILGVSALCLGAATFGTAAAERPHLAWLSGLGMLATCLCLTFLFLLFPTGHLPSRRWRPVAWFAAATLVVTMTGVLFAPGPLFDGSADENPFGVPVGGTALQLAVQLSPVLIGVAALGSITSLVVRWHSTRGEVRQQSAWLLLGGIVLLASLPVVLFAERLGVPRDLANALIGTLLIAVLPAAVGVALLRHRLLGIDLLLHRAVVVVLAWLVIGSGFALLVNVLGASPIAALLLTVVVVVPLLVVDPVRGGVDSWVDRRLLGRSAQPYDLVANLAVRLPSGSTPHDVARLLAESVVGGLGVRWCRVVLSEGTVAAGAEPGEALLVVPLTGDGEDARLECGPKTSGQPTTADLGLLRTLAEQAGLALSTTRLANRLVKAQDAERRRIERDLHDGAQQRLVALALGLSLARSDRDPCSKDQRLAEAETEVRAALEEIRALAHGLHPSVLSDAGLVAAVRSRCDASPIPVTLQVDQALREAPLPEETATCAYFVVLEAMANAVKHAQPSSLTVRLGLRGDRLRVDIEDDGRGFLLPSTPQPGLGALADRVSGLGGRLSVTSRPVGGTRVCADLPAGSDAADQVRRTEPGHG